MKNLLLFLFCVWIGQTIARGDDFPYAGKRIVFLGDSITHSGIYIHHLEARIRASSINTELVNLGLPSETCSGLSEKDHPFPRPCVLERLDRVFDKAKPEVVIVCYGINDAIYAPFDDERFAAYQDGIETILSKAKQHDVPVVLCTPPPFDAVPVKKKGATRSIDADDFSWKHIYEDYDEVLAKYSKWIRQQSDGVEMIVDLREAVSSYLKDKRTSNPDLVLAHDGIHLNAEGHTVIAGAFADAWSIPDVKIDDADKKSATKRQHIMHAAWLSHVGHNRPGVKPGLPMEEAIEAAKAVE